MRGLVDDVVGFMVLQTRTPFLKWCASLQDHKPNKFLYAMFREVCSRQWLRARLAAVGTT